MATSAHQLRVLHESEVLAEEIDALGHMNVRFYGSRALASTDRLLAELGLDEQTLGAGAPIVHDLPRLFTRYHREQHTGAPLIVRGGLLAVNDDTLRLYHELVNPERDELAATFAHDVAFRADGESERLPLPDALRKDLERSLVERPEHGAARSIDLDAPAKALSLDDALEGGLAFRLPRRIESEDCDADGRVGPLNRPFLMWGGDPMPPLKRSDGPPIVELADGSRMGWASMETRSIMVEQPMVGMRIQSFSATVEMGRKTNLRRYWVFDLDSGRMLLANEVVELALHLGERRAIEIPGEIRTEMEARARFDLR